MLPPDQWPYLDPATDRRVALITGGCSGVGYYTVLNLYLHGYCVYIAGRLRSRVMTAIHEWQRAAAAAVAADEKAHPTGELHFLEIDLASVDLVMAAVDNFCLVECRLHLLINNAGVIALPYAVTPDDFEVQLHTNYISPFLLTTQLLPVLEKTAAEDPERPPRVIYLLLVGHRLAFRYFGPGSSFKCSPNLLFTWLRYARAKTAGIHFVKMLTRRSPQVLSMAVHPGLVMNANLFTHWTRLPIIGILFWCLFQIFGYFFGVSAADGAAATVRCCLDPSLTVQNSNGAYFAKGERSQPNRVAGNMAYAAETWAWTANEMANRGISLGHHADPSYK